MPDQPVPMGKANRNSNKWTRKQADGQAAVNEDLIAARRKQQ